MRHILKRIGEFLLQLGQRILLGWESYESGMVELTGAPNSRKNASRQMNRDR